MSGELATPRQRVESAAGRGPTHRFARILGINVAVAAAAAMVLALFFVPVVPASHTFSGLSGLECQGTGGCMGWGQGFNVGDARYAELTGTWVSNGSVGLSINNGPSSVPCLHCTGSLYAVFSGTGGSFDVRGFGPFHISVVPVTEGSQLTTINVTVKEAAI